MSIRIPLLALFLASGGLLETASSAQVLAADKPQPSTEVPLVAWKTLGGRQFWGDCVYFQGWKIQQNILTQHYRLLDPEDYRYASGTFEECRSCLQDVRQQKKLPAMPKKVVLLIHGVARSSKAMDDFRDPLIKAGYHPISFDYPSTRVTIPESAEYLHQVLQSLEGVEEINFVVHSMGGLVVRSYLSKHQDKRFHRMVMLGTPNCGAELADKTGNLWAYQLILGPAGQQLGMEENFCKDLPVPKFEFGIIAGAKFTNEGYNPLIPGDDDSVVSVASTKLPGAKDFLMVNCLHTFLNSDDKAIECTLRFLQEGKFRKNGPVAPILPEPVAP